MMQNGVVESSGASLWIDFQPIFEFFRVLDLVVSIFEISSKNDAERWGRELRGTSLALFTECSHSRPFRVDFQDLLEK